jgi:hypothetical protein
MAEGHGYMVVIWQKSMEECIYMAEEQETVFISFIIKAFCAFIIYKTTR